MLLMRWAISTKMYDEPIKGLRTSRRCKSLVLREDVGFVPDYDRLILVPYGEKTQFIDEQSLLWISVEPNANKSNMDYKIERVGDVLTETLFSCIATL